METMMPNQTRQPMPVGRLDCIRMPSARHGCGLRAGRLFLLKLDSRRTGAPWPRPSLQFSVVIVPDFGSVGSYEVLEKHLH
jgi:hypothetical protein